MKQQKLLRHLRGLGVSVLREGARHTVVYNPATNQQSTVPRHRELPGEVV
jgi:hypothetical protein